METERIEDPLTYSALISYHDRNTPDLVKQQRLNRVSALTQFRNSVGATGNLIGEELGARFEELLDVFLKGESKASKSKGTLRNLKSYLRAWKRLRDDLALNADRRFRSLHEAIAYYFEQAKLEDPTLTRAKLAELAGVPSRQLHNFLKGFAFKDQSRPLVEQLEEALHAPKGTLTSFASQVLLPFTEEKSVFGKRQAKLCATPYRLKEDQYREQLNQEWREYFNFKCAPIIPLQLKLKRNQPWRLRPVAEAGVSYGWSLQHVTTKDGTRYAATAQFRFGMVCVFFGALAQIEAEGKPGIKKYDPRNFSLGWMADYRLISEVTNFLLTRFDGVYTNTVQEVLITCQTFLHKEYGWVRQIPAFGRKLIEPVSEAEWTEWCNNQLAQINHDLKELKKGGKFVQTRDPFLPIKDYIERDHPLTVMLELAQSIADYLQSHPMVKPRAKLAMERTLFLVELLTEQPLRLKMLYIMTYLEDNTGSLYKRATGLWAVRFPKEAFKNEKGAAQKPYDVPFSEYFSNKIDRYIRHVLTKIPNRGEQVFPCVRPAKNGRRTRSTSLEHAFRVATRRFVPGCKGFGPHAVRHIVATDYIKNKESGWQTAADVLHDTVETVRKAYAFLRAEDGHKFYKDYIADLRADHHRKTNPNGALAGRKGGE